jgi:ornithine cyclodeaminase/alanine dehydrogenase-like protein (mu-crystallin family)
MALFLRDEEVMKCVSMPDVIEAIEDMQRHFGQGEAYNLARRKIIAPGGLLAVMGGGLLYDGVLGVKTYTVVKGKYSFHVSLYDADTGALLCFTQANRLGQLRTGATTGVAAKYLAKQDSATVGIIGTGNQALTQLEALKAQGLLKRTKAFSRTAERRDAFARTATEALGIEVTAVDSAEAAVRDTDIVVCIAATMEPVVHGGWLSGGATLIAAGPTTWRAREVDDDALTRASRYVIDSVEQAPGESGDLASAVDRGLLQWSQLEELRHIVSGKAPGRSNRDEVIYAKLQGTGVADVAAAKLTYERARAQGLGTEMDF